jgi:hypothetical protein
MKSLLSCWWLYVKKSSSAGDASGDYGCSFGGCAGCDSDADPHEPHALDLEFSCGSFVLLCSG